MKVFVTRPIPDAGLDLLRAKGFEVVVNTAAENRAATKEELLAGAKGADAVLSVLTDKMEPDVMDAGLPTLKIIANYAVGYDNIKVDEAVKRNIFVSNTPGVLTETVAEHTFALLLSIAKRIAEGDRYSRAGMYKAWGPKLLLGADVAGKTLGIIGLGRIGSKVAHHAVHGFEMKVAYTDPKPNQEFEKEFGAKYYDKLDDLLAASDFVSIHVPLMDSTKHLINETNLKMMKKSAYLINTSRGPIVDEIALAKALKDNQIRGAALDVYELEPAINEDLKKLDNVILTPHTASATEETRNRMSVMAASNIIEVLEGRKPLNPVKPA
jgi:glyoxylate reductase